MGNMIIKFKEQSFKFKMAVIGLILLGISQIFTIFIINDFSNKFNSQTKELIEARTKLFNTELEKIDFVESQKNILLTLDDDEKREFISESRTEIKNRFKEVVYTTNDKGQISTIDFSNLDISCDTFKRIALPFNKDIFPNAKYISKCDEVNK